MPTIFTDEDVQKYTRWQRFKMYAKIRAGMTWLHESSSRRWQREQEARQRFDDAQQVPGGTLELVQELHEDLAGARADLREKERLLRISNNQLGQVTVQRNYAQAGWERADAEKEEAIRAMNTARRHAEFYQQGWNGARDELRDFKQTCSADRVEKLLKENRDGKADLREAREKLKDNKRWLKESEKELKEVKKDLKDLQSSYKHLNGVSEAAKRQRQRVGTVEKEKAALVAERDAARAELQGMKELNEKLMFDEAGW